MRRGGLHDVTVGDGLHPMNRPWTNPEGLPRQERNLLQGLYGGTGQETHLSGVEKDCFVLHFMILKRKGLASVDMKDFTDILFGLGPDQLIAPGLFDPVRSLFH
jgi:hypothetical protein